LGAIVGQDGVEEGRKSEERRAHCESGEAPGAHVAIIVYSPKCVELEFSEVRPSVLASCLLRRIVSTPVIKALSHIPPAAYPARTSLK
jgi:hypothetical protein